MVSQSLSLLSDNYREAQVVTAKLTAWRSHRELQVFLRTGPSRGSEGAAAVAEGGGEMKGPALLS